MHISRYLRTTRRKFELQAQANFQVRFRCGSFSNLQNWQGVTLIRILPCVRDLAQDQSQHVQASLTSQICGLAHPNYLFRMTTVLGIKVRDLLFGRLIY
jgi:hypothetical protein